MPNPRVSAPIFAPVYLSRAISRPAGNPGGIGMRGVGSGLKNQARSRPHGCGEPAGNCAAISGQVKTPLPERQSVLDYAVFTLRRLMNHN